MKLNSHSVQIWPENNLNILYSDVDEMKSLPWGLLLIHLLMLL